MIGTISLHHAQKKLHLPNVKRDEAHMYEGACMRVQHKMLPDGTGAGRGWIMTKQMDKGRFLLDKQAAWKAQHQTGTTWQPQHQQRQQPQQPQRHQQWQPQHQRQQQWQPHQQQLQWQPQQSG